MRAQPELLKRPRLRFAVDGWGIDYGTALDVDGLSTSKGQITADIEIAPDDWSPVDPDPTITTPDAVLFVDGVRRIDARIWIDDDTETSALASVASCASYAAGVLCCCANGAHVVAAEVRRGVFTTVGSTADILMKAGCYRVQHVTRNENTPLLVTLSSAVQQQLAETEIEVATAARSDSDDHSPIEDDLLVVDGPLHNRTHLDRTIGYVKSHQSEYLPADLNGMVSKLAVGQRTPVFHIGSDWDRYWQLTVTIIFVLPCLVLLWFLGTTLGGASAGERTVVAGLFAVAAIAIGSTLAAPELILTARGHDVTAVIVAAHQETTGKGAVYYSYSLRSNDGTTIAGLLTTGDSAPRPTGTVVHVVADPRGLAPPDFPGSIRTQATITTVIAGTGLVGLAVLVAWAAADGCRVPKQFKR